jgi:CHAT domain-containing protein
VLLADLRDLHLSCELLALSACDTGAGALTELEGASSLARAGLAAGARAVLATLWRVRDLGARDLVVDLYREWRGEGKARIAALAAAKRQAIARGAPVEDWAAYQLWDVEPGR